MSPDGGKAKIGENMLKKLIFTGSLVIGIFTVSAFAQQTETPENNPNQKQNQDQNRRQKGNSASNGSQQGNKNFNEMDLNHDGYVSKDEWTRNTKAFDRIDTNHDGQISKEEMKMARQQKGEKGSKNKPNSQN